MDKPTPSAEDMILSPAAQAIMDQILQLDPADREKLRKKLEYQAAMRDHDDQDIQLRKLDEQKKRTLN